MREIKFRAWDKEQAKMKKDFRFDEFNDVNDYFADNDLIHWLKRPKRQRNL